MNESKALSNWKTQSRKGFLDLCILNCLAESEFYGWDLVQLLKQHDGISIREGIIYPILARMQSEGYVTSEKRPSSSGPPRKYYRITVEGQEVLKEMNSHWGDMVEVIASIRKTEDGESRK